jgi:hypothetical protein
LELAADRFGSDARLAVVRLHHDFGAAFGRNIGAARAKGDYILFLDEDVELGPLCIEQFVEAMGENRGGPVGAVGMSKVPGFYMDYLGNEVHTVERGKTGALERRDTEVFGVYACACMVRKDVFHSVGGFDPDFFVLREDTDLCWRIRLAGYRVLSIPYAKVHHRGRKSHTVGRGPRSLYLTTRNRIIMLTKNYGWTNVLLFVPLAVILSIVGGVLLLFASKLGDFKGIVKALSWSVGHSGGIMAKRLATQRQRVIPDALLTSTGLIQKPNFRLLFDNIRNR